MTKSINLSDPMDPARMVALAATLGIDWHEGQALPPFAHHIYFWQPQPLDQLGRDGHPAVGPGEGLIPDFGLPRRMWAGGRLRFHAPLQAGVVAEKRSTLLKTQEKQGRSGPLAFVTLHHEIRQNGQPCVTEEQDLVYRAEASDSAPPVPKPAPTQADVTTPRRFSTVELFRYSALTLNGHRIHYDRDYAIRTEGYAGLVVHGPLLAQHLMLMAGPGLTGFAFRGASALIDHETALFCRSGDQMWIAGSDGRLCMQATRQLGR